MVIKINNNLVVNKIKTKSSYLNMYGINNRKDVIDVINDFLYNNAFKHYFKRWYSINKQVSEDVVRKNYSPYGYMDKIIDELKLLAPEFHVFNTSDVKKVQMLNRALYDMDWDSLYREIIETFETKGDFFAYWYYEQSDVEIDGWNKIKLSNGGVFWENPIPQIVVLESEKMVDIIIDSNQKPIKYVYVENYIDEQVDDYGSRTKSEIYTVTKIFEKGKIIVVDSRDNIPKYIYNKEHEKDIIRLIHIPSFKKRSEKFSEIPATKYIDLCLILDAISSDYRLINKRSAFPILAHNDIEVIDEDTYLEPGGVYATRTLYDNNPDNKPNPFAKLLEITNGLETLRDERNEVDKVFYKKTGLTRESLEEVLGRSDSSRVPSQIRITLENKYKKYFTNINRGFKTYFNSLLKYNNLLRKKDKEVEFVQPETFVNGSIFDKLEVINNKLALGLTTMREEWIKQGLTEDEIAKRERRIKEEIVNGSNDLDVTDNSKYIARKETATMNLDNKFKQETNVKRRKK